VVVGFAAEARIARRLGWPVAIGGATAAGAIIAAERLLDAGCKALVSFGLAGGLDPSLRSGVLVVPAVVIAAGQHYPTDPQLSCLLGGVSAEALAGVDAVLASAEAKHLLWCRTSAAAADLESGAVAQVAAKYGAALGVLRAICDPAERSLPPAALATLRPSGAIGFGRLITSVLVQPGQVQALLRLAGDGAAARRSLLARVKSIAQAQSP
jgi:adenosylhomocysteine nucleosidase